MERWWLQQDVLDIKSSPLFPLQPLRQGKAGLPWSTQWVLPLLHACLSAATSPPELPQGHAQSSFQSTNLMTLFPLAPDF